MKIKVLFTKGRPEQIFENVTEFHFEDEVLKVYFKHGSGGRYLHIKSVEIIEEKEFLVISNSQRQVMQTFELPIEMFNLAKVLQGLADKQPDKCVLISFIKS
jgi:hypothetical protein